MRQLCFTCTDAASVTLMSDYLDKRPGGCWVEASWVTEVDRDYKQGEIQQAGPNVVLVKVRGWKLWTVCLWSPFTDGFSTLRSFYRLILSLWTMFNNVALQIIQSNYFVKDTLMLIHYFQCHNLIICSGRTKVHKTLIQWEEDVSKGKYLQNKTFYFWVICALKNNKSI